MQDSIAASTVSKPKASSASFKKLTGIGKDPTTLTAFLPDKDREQQEEQMREQLKQEYELRQQVCWHNDYRALYISCCFLASATWARIGGFVS